MRFQFPLFVAAITVAGVPSPAFSRDQKRKSSKLSKKHPPPQPPSYSSEDMTRLFHILSTAEDYIYGAATSGDISTRTDSNPSKPTNFNGFLPQNVRRCTDALTNKTARLDPYTLTGVNSGEGELFPDLVIPGSYYKDLNYVLGSFYANSMNLTMSRLSHVLEQLHEEHFVNVVGDGHPMLMFDIDNTISYSAFNDTDNTGKVQPIRETVQLVHQWCKGWSSDENSVTAIFDCFFVTARWCSDGTATNTETFMRREFPAASTQLIDSNVMLTGAITCTCCEDFHNSWKDILRCNLEHEKGGKFVASIGDQYTDSAGPCSGLRVKLPNVWFDSSVVGNNQQYKPFSTAQLPESACSVDRAFGPAQSANNGISGSCLTDKARERAVAFSTLAFCKSLSRTNGVPNQQWGCVKEISNKPVYNNTKGTPGTDPFTCCFREDELDQDDLSCFQS